MSFKTKTLITALHKLRDKSLCFFCSEKRLFVFFLFLFFAQWGFSVKSFAHTSSYSVKEVETALQVFEQAISLSPELLNETQGRSTLPFYKVGKHKIYLDEGFWSLTRSWLRIYIKEINKDCPCDLDPNMLIEEAQNYTAQGFFKQRVVKPSKEVSHRLSYEGAHLVAKYGYTAATLKLSAEVAETFLSVFVGGKGIHILCNAIDVMIFPLVRKFQKYARVFSSGGTFNISGLLHSVKMAWLSRKIAKSQKRVFFYIDQALYFNEEELEKVNNEGPSSFFHKKGHRLLWLERLQRKTEPLFERISLLKEALNQEDISFKQRQTLERKIQKTQTQIENLSRTNRKDFFGSRFKRYLLLRSRKGRIAYMSGWHFNDNVIGKTSLWPLSLQENVLERALDSRPLHSNGTARVSTDHQASLDSMEDYSVEENLGKSFNQLNLEDDSLKADEIRVELAEEFLFKRYGESFKTKSLEERIKQIQAVEFFLKDISRIFDVKRSYAERLMRVQSIELTLTGLFQHYLKTSFVILSTGMSFSQKVRLQWAFGRFSNLVYGFSDFLSSVAIARNQTKIQFYKYESMEKLLTFFDYLYEVQTLLKNAEVNQVSVFEKLEAQEHKLRSLSLLKEKRTQFTVIPFRNKKAQCQKLVEVYQ